MLNRYRVCLAGLLILVGCAASPAASLENGSDPQGVLRIEIREFDEVDERLWRGGQPTEKAIGLLKASGIKTLINFRNETEWIEWERTRAEAAGLGFVSLPWRIQRKTNSEIMKKFLALTAQKEKGPFFMHCRRGVERTGIACAVYLYYRHGLSADDAYEKAMSGHNRLWYLRPFTKKRYREFIRELGPRKKRAARWPPRR